MPDSSVYDARDFSQFGGHVYKSDIESHIIIPEVADGILRIEPLGGGVIKRYPIQAVIGLSDDGCGELKNLLSNLKPSLIGLDTDNQLARTRALFLEYVEDNLVPPAEGMRIFALYTNVYSGTHRKLYNLTNVINSIVSVR